MLRLQEWLTETGTTQAELARAMGVSQPTVSDWVNGNISPSAENLIRLSKLTSVSIDDLLQATAA